MHVVSGATGVVFRKNRKCVKSLSKALKIFRISKHVLTLWVHIHQKYQIFRVRYCRKSLRHVVLNSFLSQVLIIMTWETILNVCKVMTENHRYRVFLIKLNSSATKFKWHSSTGTFLWILLSFTEILFAVHEREFFCCFFSSFTFSYVNSCKTMKISIQ